jgi:prophage regulatory protein
MVGNFNSAQIGWMKNLTSIVRLSRSNIYSQVKNGAFPPPILLGKRCVGWLQSDIEEWAASKRSTITQNGREKVEASHG